MNYHIMDKETKIPKLSKDEAGKLRGGFSIESAKNATTNIRKYFYDVIALKHQAAT